MTMGWRHGDGQVGAPVADECEAFLAGEWAEYLSARGERTPAWAWVNRVAHAPEVALRMATEGPILGFRSTDEWAALQRTVAESLLRHAHDSGMTVDALQRTVLVPIELGLFTEKTEALGNTELLLRILSALQHPSAHGAR